QYHRASMLLQRLTTMTPHRTRHRTLDHLSGQTAVLTSTVPIGQRPLFCPAEPRATPLCSSLVRLPSCPRRFRSPSKYDTTISQDQRGSPHHAAEGRTYQDESKAK